MPRQRRPRPGLGRRRLGRRAVRGRPAGPGRRGRARRRRPGARPLARQLQALLPPGQPLRRMPAHIADERLLGGLDLTATLQLGRPVAQRGLLAESHGGIVLVPMAERLPPGTAARLAAALDQGEVGFERDGSSQRWPCRIGVVAFDEGTRRRRTAARAPGRPAGLPRRPVAARRCANAATPRPAPRRSPPRARRWPGVTLGDELTQALCGIALRLGVASLRASVLALRAARAVAALAGHDEVQDDDALMAARLVLAPRATVLPARRREPAPRSRHRRPHRRRDDSDEPGRDDQPRRGGRARSKTASSRPPWPACPPACWLRCPARERARAPGRVGALSASPRFGRPVGSRRGEPRGGARLDLIDTLRAAAPWQKLRRATRQAPPRRASTCRPTTCACRACSSAPARPRSSSSTPRARRRCTAWPRPRVRSTCCWPTATCAATRWR